MPIDKTESHNKIVEVAKKEFLEKGYENTSMREIGRKVGMTQAGLYRHFESKEAMFNALVDPFVNELMNTAYKHEEDAYTNYDKSLNAESMISDNLVSMMKNFMVNYHDELRLLICCSHGTKYQNFIHDLTWIETRETYKAFTYLKEHGTKVKDFDEDQLHVILTAYISAVLEPIEHDWPLDKALQCLEKIEEFFIPAWKSIMGF